MFSLALGTGPIYDTEIKDDVTYENTSGKAII